MRFSHKLHIQELNDASVLFYDVMKIIKFLVRKPLRPPFLTIYTSLLHRSADNKKFKQTGITSINFENSKEKKDKFIKKYLT